MEHNAPPPPPPQKKAKKYLEFQKNHDVFPIEGLY